MRTLFFLILIAVIGGAAAAMFMELPAPSETVERPVRLSPPDQG